jgi:hypothetical protein
MAFPLYEAWLHRGYRKAAAYPMGPSKNREAKIYVAKSSKASGKQHFAQCTIG